MSKELKIKGGLNKEYKQVYVGDDPTGVYINEDGKVKLKDVVVTGDLIGGKGNLKISTVDNNLYTHGSLIKSDGPLNFDVDHIMVTSSGTEGTGGVHFANIYTTYQWLIDSENRLLRINDSTGASDTFQIEVDTNGATKISTTDFSGTAGHLELEPDGDLILDPEGGDTQLKGSTLKIDSAFKLYFDGGDNTYIEEVSADVLSIQVGGDNLLRMSENGADGNLVEFNTASAGFTQIEATAGDSGVIGGGGNDTDIDFRHSNKYYIQPGSLTITNMNLLFPSASGNFQLYSRSGGGWSVTNWKVYESDESAATATDVMWAGGNAPTYSSSGYDVFSFYWDATVQRCFGVGNAGFAVP